MKPAVVLLAAGWFAVSVWAGYELTARSFAWVDEPRFGLPAPSLPEGSKAGDVTKILSGLPKTATEAARKLKELTPKAQACLTSALGEARISAAIAAGDFRLTAAELAAVSPCLSL